MSKLFHAMTLHPGEWEIDGPTLERRRVLDFMNRHPRNGVLSWAVGPMGSGKTMTALQWARSVGRPVQYISAKAPAISFHNKSSPPNEFGKLVEDLFNACGDPTTEPSLETIKCYFDRVNEITTKEPALFIVDDLEYMLPSAMMNLQQSALEALPNIKIDRGLVISRAIDPNILRGLQAQRALRMVLPATLAFDEQETKKAQLLGVFGSATPTEAETARRNSNGWIMGMLASLGGHEGRTVNESQFRSILLNDMLLAQPAPMLQILAASAQLPYSHIELWERWFDHLGIPRRTIPTVMSQLPIQEDPEDNKRFDIVPVMKQGLQSLKGIITSEEKIANLMRLALDWYCEEEGFAAAAKLAEEHNLFSDFMPALKAACSRLAEREHWSSIAELLKHLPEDQLIKDPELTFWYFHGLVENDRWPEMKRIYQNVRESWQASTDPLVLGRATLVESWNSYMLNAGTEAFEQAEAAYQILPGSARRERLWAAGSASLAQSMRGFGQEARRWSATANYELTFLGQDSRWWHNNAGPLRYSWLAMSGMLNEAYEFSAQQLRLFDTSDAPERTRYHLLMALIDAEKLAFDSALQHLERAEQVLENKFSQLHHFRVAKANVLRAVGEYSQAIELLANVRTPVSLRFDQFARELFTRAKVALDLGNVDAAELYLSGSPEGVESWPKNFGDAHPALIAALINHHRGKNDDAILLAQTTLKEAQDCNRVYYAVTANAVLGHIYNSLGREVLRNQAISEAIVAAGDSGFQAAFIVNGVDVRTLLPSTEGNQASGMNPLFIPRGNRTGDRLTARELEVLSLVAQGLSNKQIAEQMFISVSTVKNHLASTYDKLEINNRRAAARIVQELGLINT